MSDRPVSSLTRLLHESLLTGGLPAQTPSDTPARSQTGSPSGSVASPDESTAERLEVPGQGQAGPGSGGSGDESGERFDGFESPRTATFTLGSHSSRNTTRSPRMNRNNSMSHLSFAGSESLSTTIPFAVPGGRSSGPGSAGGAGSTGGAPGTTPGTSTGNAALGNAPGTTLGVSPGSAGSPLSSSVDHIPNLPNGQPISSIHIQSPQVHSSLIEPRFVVSKQRVAQAQAASFGLAQRTGSQSGLLYFFALKNKLTARRDSSTDLGTFYNNSYNDSTAASSPSSMSSAESAGPLVPSRHNSMANLKRFFKKTPTPAREIPASSNLLALLRGHSSSFSGSGGFATGMSAMSSNYGNNGVGGANNGGAGGPSGGPGAALGAGFAWSGQYGTPGSLTASSSNASYSQSPGGVSRSSSIHNLYPERRPLVLTVLNAQQPFSKRYSKMGDSLGAGAGGAVNLVTRLADKKTFAVKEFRAKYANESKRDYAKKITGEYCIGLTLKHPNIIETVEICYENERILQVMEYCDFDLFAIVMSNKMSREEINCCFKQVLLGVAYIHSLGLSHRDLKLDNCVIDARGIVKIIDFGSAVVFSYPFSRTLIESHGIVGSDPYLAPEVCVFHKYDPRPVDIWSAAIIYCCMMLKKFPWKVPKLTDNSFKMFASRADPVPLSDMLKKTPATMAAGASNSELTAMAAAAASEAAANGAASTANAPNGSNGATAAGSKKSAAASGSSHTSTEAGPGRLLLALPEDCRPLIGRMVELAPACRIPIEDCFKDEWLMSVNMCTVEEQYGPDGAATFEVVRAEDHDHTQVDQAKAHISAFEKKKK